MVSIRYSGLVFSGTCPHCDSPLSELFDLWGPFYACEDCGYEFDPLELELKRRFLEEVMEEVGVEGPWVQHIKRELSTRPYLR